MSVSQARFTPEEALLDLQVLLARLDPNCRVRVDDASGKIVVHGQIEAKQLDEALNACGFGLLNESSADPGTTTMNCGCGCGCG